MTKLNLKPDLTLLKRMVSELEISLANADKITRTNIVEYTVEMNKASGLTTGVFQEAMMLVGDIQATIQEAGGGMSQTQKDVVSTFFGKMKGSGGAN
jgi:hypothetical protein